MKFFFLLILFLCLGVVNTYAQDGNCPPSNIGFEDGTFNGWQCYIGRVVNDGAVDVNSSPPTKTRQTIFSKASDEQTDPFGGFPTLCPYGGKYSIRLGNRDTGAAAERVSYTFTVPANTNSYNIIFYYAVVFQNPHHLDYQQPRFTVKTYNLTDNTYIDCASFDFIAGGVLPGFRLAPVIAPADTGVYYKDWSPSTINLQGCAGKQIRLEFTTNDCTLGGHFGYAYLDVDENCGSPITGNTYCSNQRFVNLTAPGGFLDYEWYSGNLSKKLFNGQVLSISPPPPDGTKYAVVLYPYPGEGCNDTLYTTVNKIPANLVFKAVDSLFACAGGSVDLTASSVTAGSDNDLLLSYSPDVDGLGYLYKPQAINKSGTYYIKATDTAGCSNILPVVVAIGDPPLVITDPPPVYSPATVDISSTFTHYNKYTYKYCTDAAAQNQVSDYQHIAKSGNYYVQASSAIGCSTIASVVVTINPFSPIIPGAVTGYIAACAGTASASPNLQQFTVSGSKLSADITVTAPTGFEVSLTIDGGGYGGAVILPQSAGVVNTTTIYVRAAAANKPGSISGNVTLSSAGVASHTVAVTAVIYTSPTVTGFSNQNVLSGKLTNAVNFTGTGNTFYWVNDTPGIGLPANGTGDIPSFKALNTGSTPITATITVTPFFLGYAYIANFGDGTVSVINTGTKKVANIITVGSQAYGVSVSPNSNVIYVTNQNSNTVSVVDASSNMVTATIPVGESPNGIVVSPDGSKVYAVNGSSRSVSVIDAVANKVTSTIPLGNIIPENAAVSADGSKLYVTSNSSKNITVVNTTTQAVISTIPLSDISFSLVLSRDGKTLYVTLPALNTVDAINTATNTLIAQIAVGSNPYGITVSPDGSEVFVANKFSNSVSVINAATNIVTATIAVGQNPIALSVSSDGSRLFVTNQGSNTVSLIDASTNLILSTIPVGVAPESLGNFVSTGNGCGGPPGTFTITVNPSPTQPVLSGSGELSGLTTIYGTPSQSTNFNVQGKALTEGILVTPPPGFEVSLDNKTFHSAVTVGPVGAAGIISSTPVYIRLAATTPVGSYAGDITLSSAGADDFKITMPNSTVTPTLLTIAADDKSKTAGMVNPVLTATYIGFVNSETPAKLTPPPVITTTALTGSPVGQYPITASGASSLNYIISYLAGVLTIYPAPPSIVVPNTFTPNGDGVNDTWDIKFISSYPGCLVDVFNRYGEKVYTSIGYTAPWDGTYKGLRLPSGTYYYIINLKNGMPASSGFIALIR